LYRLESPHRLRSALLSPALGSGFGHVGLFFEPSKNPLKLKATGSLPWGRDARSQGLRMILQLGELFMSTSP
jgi:hypothetical protein